MTSNNTLTPVLHQRLARSLIAFAEGRTSDARRELEIPLCDVPEANGTYLLPTGEKVVVTRAELRAGAIQRGGISHPAYRMAEGVRYVPGLDLYISDAPKGRMHLLSLYEDSIAEQVTESATFAEAKAAAVPVPAAAAAAPNSAETLRSRLARLDQAVTRWQQAPTLRVAHEAAEEARNLVVGANGPFYGDADRDGKIGGANSMGVLPGLRGEAGLANPNENSGVDADVLGGRWSDPAMRWSQLQRAIASWTLAKNTFPSHPQRVVGWASLTLNSKRPADAHEYARHAQLHVDISLRALHNCRR